MTALGAVLALLATVALLVVLTKLQVRRLAGVRPALPERWRLVLVWACLLGALGVGLRVASYLG